MWSTGTGTAKRCRRENKQLQDRRVTAAPMAARVRGSILSGAPFKSSTYKTSPFEKTKLKRFFKSFCFLADNSGWLGELAISHTRSRAHRAPRNASDIRVSARRQERRIWNDRSPRKAVARHMVDVSATSKVWTAYRAVLTSMSCSRQKSTQAFLLFAPRMASCVDRECRELVGLTSTVSGGDRERFLLFFWTFPA
jgi:hypothetical protein